MKKKEKKPSEATSAALSHGEKEKRGGRVGLFSFSIILYLFDKFTNAVYSALMNGLFGRIFTSYSPMQSSFENGFVKNYFTSNGKLENKFRKFKKKLSQGFEQSFLLGWIGNLIKSIMSSKLKLYGNFCLSFGLYSVLAYFIRSFVPFFRAPDDTFLLISIVSIIVSIPLMLSKESLAGAVGSGRITRLIFADGFGFKDENFDVPIKKSRGRANLAILFGMLLGLLCFVIHPIFIVFSIAATAIFTLILITPEIGIVLVAFLLPFFSLFEEPSVLLAIFVLVATAGYLIKLVRGKRVLKLEIIDLFVLFFAIVIYMSGLISAGGKSSLYSAILSCTLMLGYFLTVNLMRTEKWLSRCASAIVSSSVIVAAIGVFQYIFGYARLDWLDLNMFSDIKGRVVSVFENPNILAAYLTITFPLLLYKTIKASTKAAKLLGFFSILTVVACTVFTWSRAAWVAMILSIIIMGLINSRKTFKVLFVLLLSLPVVSFFIPHSVVNRFMSIGSMADSSTYYRVYTWRGSFEALKDYFFGGMGYGTSAYMEIYPQYAYAGMEAVEHSHNLFLQIMLSAGIFGFLIFAVVMFMFAQKNFEYFKSAEYKSVKLSASAAFAGVCGVLIMGLFDYVWYSYRVFYMFWFVMALSCAYIRFGNRESERKRGAEYIGPSSASVDI